MFPHDPYTDLNPRGRRAQLGHRAAEADVWRMIGGGPGRRGAADIQLPRSGGRGGILGRVMRALRG